MSMPGYRTSSVRLPLTDLHVLEVGHGPPLILLPATISLLENWVDLSSFMGQWFDVHFLELPGHGESTPFAHGFSSQLMAQTVGDLADAIGAERFSLMGFSFGGILAMRTYQYLSSRVNKIIIISPCLGRAALRFSPLRQAILRWFCRAISGEQGHRRFMKALRNPIFLQGIARALQFMGKVESVISLEKKLRTLQDTTMDVLTAQVSEILSAEFAPPPTKHPLPCYFSMSVYDPLLDFNITQEIVHRHFANVSTLRTYFPFHQAPVPFTFDDLNREFGAAVDAFLQPAGSTSQFAQQ